MNTGSEAKHCQKVVRRMFSRSPVQAELVESMQGVQRSVGECLVWLSMLLEGYHNGDVKKFIVL